MSNWTKARDGFTHYVLPVAAGVGAGIATGNPAVGVGVGGALLSAGQADLAQKAQAAANAQNWQHQKDLTSLAYQHDLEMADYNNEWNSYANQAKLMQQAGLNPAVMFGEGNLASGSHAGASSVPSPTPMQSLYDSDLINAQNNMISNLIDAGIQVAKTPKELDKMDAEIQDMLSSAKNKDAATAYQELQTELDRTFASFERQQGLDKIAADIKYTLAKEMLTLKQGELVDEQKVNTWMDTILKRSQKLLNEQNYKMLVQQAPVILQNLIKTGKQIEATTNNIETNTSLAPYNAVTGRISANAAVRSAIASEIGASASKYSAEHPNTWSAFVGRMLSGAFGGDTPEQIGKHAVDWLRGQGVQDHTLFGDIFHYITGSEYNPNAGNMPLPQSKMNKWTGMPKGKYKLIRKDGKVIERGR